MVGKSKISKFQAVDDEKTLIVPKEELAAPIELSKFALDKLVKREKRPQSEAQKAATLKLMEYNKARREEAKKPEVAAELAKKKQEELEKRQQEELALKKAEQEAKLAAGTHVRVVLKPKKKRTVRKPVETTETETTETEPPTETEFETEDDTDMEEYKKKARAVHRAKKVVKTIKKIDQVLQAPVNVNPYTALLSSRWR